MLTERRDDGSVWISHGRKNGKLTSKSRNRWFLTIGCVWTKTNNCTNDNSYDPYCWHRHDLIKPSPLTGNRPFLGPSSDNLYRDFSLLLLPCELAGQCRKSQKVAQGLNFPLFVSTWWEEGKKSIVKTRFFFDFWLLTFFARIGTTLVRQEIIHRCKLFFFFFVWRVLLVRQGNSLNHCEESAVQYN